MMAHLNYAFESTAKLAHRSEGIDNGCGKEGKKGQGETQCSQSLYMAFFVSLRSVRFFLLIPPFKVGADMYNFRSIEEKLTLHLGRHYLVSLCILMKSPKHLP